MHHLYKVLGVCVEISTLNQVQCVDEKRYKLSILKKVKYTNSFTHQYAFK